MSTRGLIGFRVQDRLIGAYNHSDSYPSWLGAQVVDFVSKRLRTPEQVEGFKANVAGLVFVESDKAPDLAAWKHYLAFAEAHGEKVEWSAVHSMGKKRMKVEWYGLLRDFQGICTLYGIEAGVLRHLEEYSEFLKDSLFCEYAYILDLEAGVLEFYEGFLATAEDPENYGPCALVGTVPFGQADLKALNGAFGLEGEAAVTKIPEQDVSWISERIPEARPVKARKPRALGRAS